MSDKQDPCSKPNETEAVSDEGDIDLRITEQLVQQLKPFLPIYSLQSVTEKLDELVVHNQRLPLSLLAPHISERNFPIKNVEDLTEKVRVGVRRALSLGQSKSFQVRSPAFSNIQAAVLKGSIGRLPRPTTTYALFSMPGATNDKGTK